MLALFTKLLDWFRALFWKEEMELTLVGLQYSGKTTFVNVIAVRRQSRGKNVTLTWFSLHDHSMMSGQDVSVLLKLLSHNISSSRSKDDGKNPYYKN
uniref:Uncharacterized protein n=1 Tax=Sphaerodactylus townsendi TaxID=933632 RepID=A0ACB8F6A8_9SAUR